MAYYNPFETKRNTSPQAQVNNKVLSKVIETDYEKIMTFDGAKWLNGNTPLLSYSTAIKGMSELTYYKIPKATMMMVQDEGKAVMYYLQMIVDEKINDLRKIDFNSEKVKKMVYALLQCLLENDLRLIAVEKHICNSHWHGYIDCIVVDKKSIKHIVEIKTRSNFDVRETDILQLMTYNAIIGVNVSKILIIVNRKQFTAQAYKIDNFKQRKMLGTMNNMLEVVGLKDYKLEIKPQKKENIND